MPMMISQVFLNGNSMIRSRNHLNIRNDPTPDWRNTNENGDFRHASLINLNFKFHLQTDSFRKNCLE